MKKIPITLALIMASISVAVASNENKDMTFPSYNIDIQNVGAKNLYIALSSASEHYSNH